MWYILVGLGVWAWIMCSVLSYYGIKEVADDEDNWTLRNTLAVLFFSIGGPVSVVFTIMVREGYKKDKKEKEDE